MSEEKHETKQRLLDAAEALFAAKDFDEVSIRELAAAADVNVAAVNYHFQGKQNLFQEVVLRRFSTQRDRALAALTALLEREEDPDLEQVVHILAERYLTGALAEPDSATFMGLVAREMHKGNLQAGETFFRDMIAPIFMAFSGAIRRARPHLSQDQVNWIMASIVGQIQHFIFRWKQHDSLAEGGEARRFMHTAFPLLAGPVEDYVTAVTAHIARFSAAAVDSLYPEVSR